MSIYLSAICLLYIFNDEKFHIILINAIYKYNSSDVIIIASDVVKNDLEMQINSVKDS